MGDRYFNIPDFLPAEKAKILGFSADVHFRLLLQFQRVYHDHHAPDAAVPEGGDPAGVVVHRQLPEPFRGDAQSQFFIDFPDDGLPPGLPFFAAAADQPPDVGVAALFQQQAVFAGDDGVRPQMGGHGGFRRVLGGAVVKGHDCHGASSRTVSYHHNTTISP